MDIGMRARGALVAARMPLAMAATAVSVALVLTACAGAAESPALTVPPTGVIATPVVGGPGGAVSPIATPVPTDSAPASATPAGTTSTDFGAIRDAVPPTFPLPPDLQPADVPDGAWSGTYSTPTPAGAVASAILAGLEDAGWTSVTVSDPTEAGEVTIDATGSAAGCRARVTVGPLGGLTVVKVLYGASCPTE